MNCLAFTPFIPDKTFPWFEEYEEHNKLCKVYHDGGHYVASVIASGGLKKKKKTHFKTSLDDYFDELYLLAIKEGLSKKELKSFLFDNLSERCNSKENLEGYIEERLEMKRNNLYARKKRFRRKAFLNEWNYFVTFTYDDSLHDECSFKKSLRKCLSNLHTRRGWLYMGVFERAPETGRLHFHGLFNIPEGQMLGGLYECRDYSKKNHKMVITHPNPFFELKFGRNDFSRIDEKELRSGRTLSYILKYIEKTDERIIYSRGIPTDFMTVLNDSDIAAEMEDFVLKMILFDDVIDYERDVIHKYRVKSEKHRSLLYQHPRPS